MISLTEIRTRLGMSQEDLSRKLGVSWRTIQRWESGLSKPTGLYKEKLERFIKRAERRGTA